MKIIRRSLVSPSECVAFLFFSVFDWNVQTDPFIRFFFFLFHAHTFERDPRHASRLTQTGFVYKWNKSF